jgi:malate dehydrogenase (quinone)
MLELMQHCFGANMKSDEWLSKLKQMIPSYGRHLADDAHLCAAIRGMTAAALQLSGYEQAAG